MHIPDKTLVPIVLLTAQRSSWTARLWCKIYNTARSPSEAKIYRRNVLLFTQISQGINFFFLQQDNYFTINKVNQTKPNQTKAQQNKKQNKTIQNKTKQNTMQNKTQSKTKQNTKTKSKTTMSMSQ